MKQLYILFLCTSLILALSACTAEVVITTDNPNKTENSERNEGGDDNDEENKPSEPEDNQGENDAEDEGGEDNNDNQNDQNEENSDNSDNNDTTIDENPAYFYDMEAWSGEWADDSYLDNVGSNADLYHELNTFNNTIIVHFDGSNATIDSNNSSILHHIDGGYVTIDMQTNSVANTEIILLGKSNNGGLKIYGDKKFKLSLYGLDLTSQRGPAINSQCKKRVFIDLADGTTNRLTDCASYTTDSYTMPGIVNEDRKGALFTEGHIILSGSGALVVEGRYKHAIVTDGYYYQRPGVTIAVTGSAKNGIHVKGDDEDGIGTYIAGGVIHADIRSTAGKGIKCDTDVVVTEGRLRINTSGDATYDSEARDTSSAAGIKCDGNLTISGGTLTLSSSGSGGKGLNADGNLTISGGNTSITTSGGQYKYSSSMTSSPKGVRVDGDIYISGGHIDIEVTGRSEGSEGLESKSSLTIDGTRLRRWYKRCIGNKH